MRRRRPLHPLTSDRAKYHLAVLVVVGILSVLPVGLAVAATKDKWKSGEQRVALARMLGNEPTVILADEPTGNLDPETSQQVVQFFEEFNRESRTVVMVTHDPQAVERANRTLRLTNGSIVSGTPPLHVA